ncbi:MAG: hypothetical protein ACYS32_06870 [Planctomycetota bacterium]|jgi:DNA-binding Lrp family transcriptional regulator
MAHVKNTNTTKPKGLGGSRYGALFELVSNLFYRPKMTLSELSRDLGVSPTTVKRMLGFLRHQQVIRGRLGSVRLNLTNLPGISDAFCRAIFTCEPAIKHLKELSNLPPSDSSHHYCSEEGLLAWICNELPSTEPYKGKIVVQNGCVVMGAQHFGILFVVYAASTEALFEFARMGVEMEEGINRTETLMIAYALR